MQSRRSAIIVQCSRDTGLCHDTDRYHDTCPASWNEPPSSNTKYTADMTHTGAGMLYRVSRPAGRQYTRGLQAARVAPTQLALCLGQRA